MGKISSIKRIVVKIGSNVIASYGVGLDNALMCSLAEQVTRLRVDYGIQSLIISSGAVVCGRLINGSLGKTNLDTQVAAIFGQPNLIDEWRRAFGQCGIKEVGQILYTDSDLKKPQLPLLRAMEIGPVIINGNDAVFDREIKQLPKAADNDYLSCLSAINIHADMLISLTSVDGVLDLLGRVIPVIKTGGRIKIMKACKTMNGTGGMRPKIKHLRNYVMQTGGTGVIANGKAENVIWRIVHGERVGTWIIK